MKNQIIRMLLVSAFVFTSLSSCTERFLEYNTSPNGIYNKLAFGEALVASKLKLAVVRLPADNQIAELYTGSQWSGYVGEGSFNSKGESLSCYFWRVDWENHIWGEYSGVMNDIETIKGDLVPGSPFDALLRIVRIEGAQRSSSFYGPLTYTTYGMSKTSAIYDSEETLYKTWFKELDTYIDVLNKYVSAKGANFDKKWDPVYDGDYKKWLQYANSLRLRLAMRVVYADPALAKENAEKAVDPANGGVIESNTGDFFVKGELDNSYVVAYDWGDMRMGADMESYLVGYNDPRLPLMWNKCIQNSNYPGIENFYKGIRIGTMNSKSIRNEVSSLPKYCVPKTNPQCITGAAVAWFLRAEGALWGWNMGGTAKELYEKGVKASFAQWKLSVSSANTYLADNASKPIDWVDYYTGTNKLYDIKAMSDVTIAWDESDNFERKQERILTQKWIAQFPNGIESWAEFRRTGYPKLFPTFENFSSGQVAQGDYIKRCIYPVKERTGNPEYSKIQDVLGGPDEMGTRLWWDKK